VRNRTDVRYSRIAALVGVACFSALSLAACAGSKSNTQSSAYTNGTRNAQRNGMAGNMAGQAPVDVNCGAVQPVWVNLRSHVYHESGDPYYGRTRNGRYMCPNQARAEGDRPAGSSANSGSSYGGGNSANGTDQNGTSANGAYDNSATTTRHHRKHHRSY